MKGHGDWVYMLKRLSHKYTMKKKKIIKQNVKCMNNLTIFFFSDFIFVNRKCFFVKIRNKNLDKALP